MKIKLKRSGLFTGGRWAEIFNEMSKKEHNSRVRHCDGGKTERTDKALAPSDISNRYLNCLQHFSWSFVYSADTQEPPLSLPSAFERCYCVYDTVKSSWKHMRSCKKTNMAIEQRRVASGSAYVCMEIFKISKIITLKNQRAACANNTWGMRMKSSGVTDITALSFTNTVFMTGL